jgi:hypothetical protein
MIEPRGVAASAPETYQIQWRYIGNPEIHSDTCCIMTDPDEAARVADQRWQGPTIVMVQVMRISDGEIMYQRSTET